MFGKKKEEWEHIGTENYFQNEDCYEEYNEKIRPTTEYLTGIFKPYLYKDEQILCVFGNGEADGYLDEDKLKRNALKALMITAPSCIAVFAFVYLIDGWPRNLLAFFIMFLITGIPTIAFLTIFLYVAMSSSSIKANYAVTNKRILAMVQNEWQEISLTNVVETRVRKKQGSIIVTSKADGRMDRMGIFHVSDPVVAKNLIDDIIEKCKAAEAQGR